MVKINNKQHITKTGVIKKNPVKVKRFEKFIGRRMNKDEAIKILNKRGTYVKDLKKVDYQVYDEDFSFFMTEKELIDYAIDQSEEEW